MRKMYNLPFKLFTDTIVKQTNAAPYTRKSLSQFNYVYCVIILCVCNSEQVQTLDRSFELSCTNAMFSGCILNVALSLSLSRGHDVLTCGS